MPHTDLSITGDYEVITRESYEHIKVATSLITQAPVAARKSYQIGLTDGCGQIVRLHTYPPPQFIMGSKHNNEVCQYCRPQVKS